MSAPAFTPGPWSIRYHKKLQPDHHDRPRNIMGPDGKIVATFTDTGGLSWRSGDEKRANARLIAAAPELYEALKSAADALRDAHRDAALNIREFDGGVVHCSAFSVAADRAEAALAKARGDQ